MTTKKKILTAMQTHKAHLSAFGINKIGLFGSYVRNEQTPHSDIDILVDFVPAKETFDNYMGLYDYLETLFANEKVEVVTLNGLSPYIGPQILEEVNYA
ncbi:nucleotidyltransferase [Bacteroidia bacterium]|nr:nucleotidyltransferase [Bacteroidia bacterium]